VKIAQEHEPVPCPRCGNRMTRHAEKVVFGDDAGDASDPASASDGIVDEFHTCPACRYVLERRSR
jgi:DNA-directed RNA polymerase subunit RPC12/RpoP